MDKQELWKIKQIIKLRSEAVRLVEKIDDLVDEDYDIWPSKRWAAVKRASLDVNVEGVKLRKGWYKEL